MISKSVFLSAAMISLLMASGCSMCRSEKDGTPVVLMKCAVSGSDQSVRKNLPRSGSACSARDLTLEMTYTSEKPLEVEFKPENRPIETYHFKRFPATKEPQTVCSRFRFHELTKPSVPTMMVFRSRGKFSVNSLTVTENGTALPDSMIPLNRRKNNSTHKRIMADAAKAPKDYVLMFGDSLTDNWRGGKRFDYMKKNLPVVNAGICGDKVEDVLFRMNEMAEMLKKNPPSVVTFLIGVNNAGVASKAEDVADGIWHLVWQIHQYCPKTKVIVFGITPYRMPDFKRANPYSYQINRLLLARANQEGPQPVPGAIQDFRYMYFDFSSMLADPDLHLLRKDLYESDCLHFSDKGYAEVLTPFIAGAIRLVRSENLPPHYLQNNLNWQRYLYARYATACANFSMEEQIGLEWHLKCITTSWLEQFKKLEKDPKAVPGYPEELVRQAGAEGLPPAAGINL